MVTAGQSQGVLELPAAIQKPLYRRVHLEYGIHLEIPSHWRSLPEDARLNLGASAHGMLDDAGINGGLDGKRRLLAVNSRPEPNGAMIRVSVESPSDIAETDLAGVIGADLKRVEAGLAGMFARLEKSGGPKILEMQRARVGEFNDRRALIVSYVRAGTYGQSPWQVTQYKIPVANALIELTLSYRQSDGAVWRPILGRVKRSMDLRGVSFSGSGSVRSSQALQERDSALSVVIAFQEIADRYARASKEMTAAAAEFIKEDQKSDSSVRHLERVKSTLIRCEAAFRNHEEIRQEGHDYLLLNEGSFDRGFLEDSLFGFGDESVVQYNRAFFRFSSEYRETIDYLILNYERIMSSSEPEASVYYAKWRNSSALRQEHDEAYLRKIAALKSRHGEEELKAAMEALEH
nr:hypothetical protein 20 [Desulfobacterales bacterium]